MTSFIYNRPTDKAALLLKASHKEQVLFFVFCKQKNLAQMSFSLKCVQCIMTSNTLHIIIIIIIKNDWHSNVIVNRLQGCGHSRKLRESESESRSSKSFDRRGVGCKNARTVQFSSGVEQCPVTQKTALPLANCSTHELQLK